MESEWIGSWRAWKTRSTWLKCLSVIPRAFMLPVASLIVLFAPNSKQAKFYGIPVNKFLFSVANYLLFLTFVFLQSHSDKTGQLRGPPNTGARSELSRQIYASDPLAPPLPSPPLTSRLVSSSQATNGSSPST